MSTDAPSSTSPANSLPTSSESVVKQARDLGRDMQDQAGQLAQSAKEALKTQADNLTDSAKEVASNAGEKLRASVREQKAAGADYVGNVAGIIRRTAYEFDTDIPQAGHYIRKAAAQLENVSDAMRTRDMSEIIGNVQDFARKQPTAFFGAAVLLGFATVRFFKSGSGAPNSGSSSSTAPANVGGPTTGL